MVESLIEQRHALASLALKKHYIGAVRIPLSNRLPMIERMVERGTVSGVELLEEFAQCCSLLKMPDAFGGCITSKPFESPHTRKYAS